LHVATRFEFVDQYRMAIESTPRASEWRITRERELMDDYVRGAGHDPRIVRARTDDAARMLLLSAAAFAASRLRREPPSS
jgi:hypothetical protein